ncbi:hypothetical protein DFH09DRAFT_1275461 [Mycena vulgaris]|nr:hypothetical protein DFH09DRAFT_1275461 [Mycena vulgaris]
MMMVTKRSGGGGCRVPSAHGVCRAPPTATDTLCAPKSFGRVFKEGYYHRPNWDYSGRPDRKAQTGGKPEWCRSCRNEEAEVNRKEVVQSGPGTVMTGNGPGIKSKYEKDIQRLRHNPGVEPKTRIERGDSVHEGKHGITLFFQMKYWTWLRQIYTKSCGYRAVIVGDQVYDIVATKIPQWTGGLRDWQVTVIAWILDGEDVLCITRGLGIRRGRRLSDWPSAFLLLKECNSGPVLGNCFREPM